MYTQRVILQIILRWGIVIEISCKAFTQTHAGILYSISFYLCLFGPIVLYSISFNQTIENIFSWFVLSFAKLYIFGVLWRAILFRARVSNSTVFVFMFYSDRHAEPYERDNDVPATGSSSLTFSCLLLNWMNKKK